MGIIDGIKQYFADPSIPVGGKIFKHNTTEFQGPLKQDYISIEKLLEDERVVSIVAMMASMVQKSYLGIEIHPINRYTDTKIDPKEEKAMQIADTFARTMKFKQLCFDYAWQIVSHGDMFEKIIKGSEGVEKLVNVPLSSTRVLADKAQANSVGQGAQILEENFISVKKHENDTSPDIIAAEDYLHLSYKNHAVWKKDIERTDTYGIYSISPLAPLQHLVNWKKKTIENDIIWKNKLLPKILWTLKMPSIVPSKYTGTQEEKVAAAMADADKLTANFIQATKSTRPDDDLTVSDAVEGKILEANSTNYHAPNESISQINTMLNSTHGIPSGLLGGEVGASMGMELAGVFAGIRVDYIAHKIADALTDVLHRHLRIVESTLGEEVISRLYVHTDTALSVEKFEKVKTALSMSASGEFTKSEVRQAAGYPRLPQLPKEAFPDNVNRNHVADTKGDKVGNVKQEKPGSSDNNNGPESRRNGTENQD